MDFQLSIDFWHYSHFFMQLVKWAFNPKQKQFSAWVNAILDSKRLNKLQEN